MTTVTLRYFDGCPNWKVALDRLHEAINEVGVDHVHIDLERVETPERAQKLRFRGSPTILIDGTDPFADEGDQVGLSCRIFQTDEGPQGSPTRRQLKAALLDR